jgi:hypothetical protein
VRRHIHLVAAAVLAMLVSGLLAWPAKSQVIALGGALAEAKRVQAAADSFLAENECVGPINQAQYNALLEQIDDIFNTLQNMFTTGGGIAGRVVWPSPFYSPIPPAATFVPGGPRPIGGQGGNLSRRDLYDLEVAGRKVLQRRDKLKGLPRCPTPPPTRSYQYEPGKGYEIEGYYAGGQIIKNFGRLRSTETLAGTDAVTNQFTDTGDPIGGGVIVGYNFAPWANNIVVGPFASFDFIHAPVNHTFPGGSFLGTTDNFVGTAGVKFGPQLDAGPWLYGIAGLSVLNETLHVNFTPVASSSAATVPGATVGVGGAWQPAFLQGFGRPVSLFLEYQHTWWQSANFNTPAASPLFNYNFARDDDTVKFGFTVSLGAPPPTPAPPSMVFKAPASK